MSLTLKKFKKSGFGMRSDLFETGRQGTTVEGLATSMGTSIDDTLVTITKKLYESTVPLTVRGKLMKVLMSGKYERTKDAYRQVKAGEKQMSAAHVAAVEKDLGLQSGELSKYADNIVIG